MEKSKTGMYFKNAIGEITVPFEDGPGLKKFTDKIIRKSLFDMLIDIKKVKALVIIDHKENNESTTMALITAYWKT